MSGSDVLGSSGQLNRLRRRIQIELDRRGRGTKKRRSLHRRDEVANVDLRARPMLPRKQLFVIGEIALDSTVDENGALAADKNLIFGKRDLYVRLSFRQGRNIL